MTKRRLFVIDENAAVAIIMSRFHGNWNGLQKILEERNIDIDGIENDEGWEAAIKQLPDSKIEAMLNDIEY